MKSCLIEQIENTAEWRREKAKEHPEDQRNGEAADILDRLTKELAALRDDDASVAAYEALIESGCEDGDVLALEEHNRLISRIGFDSAPSSAEELLSGLTEGLRRHSRENLPA